LHEAHRINAAAHRAIQTLKHEQWVFALFPAGTRVRRDIDSSQLAIPETDSYLKSFDFLLLGRIDGCTLPVSRDQAFTHETPVLDRVRIAFGPVQHTAEWRAQAQARYPAIDQRSASARAIVDDVNAIEPLTPE
jgi:glycerol-3-phosphate O-acyltransferase